MSRIKEIVRLTAQIKTQSVSMQRRLLLYWFSMLLAIGAVLVLILSVAGVFSNESEKAHDSLQLQLNNAKLEISQHMESLEAYGIALSEQISRELDTTLTANGLTVDDLNDNPELLLTLQKNLLPRLHTALQLSQCSGAYLVLNATTNTQSDKASHSATGLYLRYANLQTTGAAKQDVTFFRGIPEVGRAERLELHNRWNLEFDTDLFPGYYAWMQTEVGRLADACCWTERFRLTDTWEDVLLLCVPIKDNTGKVCGLCGLELSSLYCYLSYPEMDSSFGPMITVLAPLRNGSLYLSKGMTGSADSTFLAEAETLSVRQERYFNVYSNGSDSYIGLDCEVGIRGADGNDLTLAVMIPESTFDASRTSGRVLLICCSLALAALTLCLSVFLSKRFVQPILQTIQAIRSEKVSDGAETGISELDELMALVCSKSNEKLLQNDHALPPNVEELFQTFAERAKTLSSAERAILQYYIDGHEITEIPELAFISIHTVKKHNSNIYQKLGISSRDELMLYIDIFRRLGRLNELTEPVME